MEQPPKKWPDHMPGQSYILKDNNVYINISKNASTTMKQSMRHTFNITPDKWKSYYSEEVQSKANKFVVILRDPFDRWVSGYLEYLSRNPGTNMRDFLTKDQIVFDEHTDTQSYFLDFDVIDLSRTYFFYMKRNDDKLIERINSVVDLGLQGYPPQNVKNTNPDRSQLLELVSEYNMDSKIKQYYIEDYALIATMLRENRLW